MKSDERVTRLHQAILIVSTILGSWLGMQAVHEFGHVVGAWLTGGRVARVVLHPLANSRTDLAVNPHPLPVVWAGPVLGVLLPLGLWKLADSLRLNAAFVLRFFAGFCLIANGAYIAVGSFDRIGDAGEMLKHGSAAWQLWLFGATTIPAGFWLWHGQGRQFGLGAAKGTVRRNVAYATLAGCAALLLLGLIVDGK
jgi:hypothetical protein